MLAWEGLVRYGMVRCSVARLARPAGGAADEGGGRGRDGVRPGQVEDAERLAYRWLYMITRSFVDYNGTVPEKYDVVLRTHKFQVEYGNVGTDFAYITREGFGWMNASYQVALAPRGPPHGTRS